MPAIPDPQFDAFPTVPVKLKGAGFTLDGRILLAVETLEEKDTLNLSFATADAEKIADGIWNALQSLRAQINRN